MKKTVITMTVTLALVALVGVVWLRAAPTIGAVSADPAYIVINTTTPVVFTAQITDASFVSANLLKTDASGKALATVGVMRDDGTNGDAVAGDRVFSYRVSLNQPAVGQVHYRVSAAFRGVLQRVQSTIVPVTIDPFQLPPDPGEAGRQTLEGIDSDGDGVRDDVQRHIGLIHPNSARRRAPLTQLAITQQQFLNQNGSNANALDEIDAARDAAANCLEYVFGAAVAATEAANLKSRLLDTTERIRAFAASDRALGGGLFFLADDSNLKAGCTLDPDQLPGL